MSEQDGLPLSESGMIVEKLDGTNYRMWSIRIAAYLGTEGLWDLMTGTEEVLKVPEKEDTDYKALEQEYISQRRRVQKHQENVVGWSTVVLNAPGPHRSALIHTF